MKKSIGIQTSFYPAPIFIVGTYNIDMQPNVMTAALGGLVSGKPAAIGVCLRKATLTHESIIRNKVFTVSIPSEDYVKEIDYIGITSGRNNNKFLDTGLTPIKGTHVDAPYIDEFPINLECKLIETIDLGFHTQFIGEIVDVKVNEELLNEKEMPNIEKMRPISFLGSDRCYYGLGNNLGTAFSIGKDFKPNKE